MEHGLPIVIDDQESLREAILFNVAELNSHIMHLYLAGSNEDAHRLIGQSESIFKTSSRLHPLVANAADKSLTISSYHESEYPQQMKRDAF